MNAHDLQVVAPRVVDSVLTRLGVLMAEPCASLARASEMMRLVSEALEITAKAHAVYPDDASVREALAGLHKMQVIVLEHVNYVMTAAIKARAVTRH